MTNDNGKMVDVFITQHEHTNSMYAAAGRDLQELIEGVGGIVSAPYSNALGQYVVSVDKRYNMGIVAANVEAAILDARNA